MYKLPVWGTVSTVYAFIWHERMAWFKFALALLTLVLIGFALMMLQVFGISLLSENAEGNGLVIVLLGLIILFFLAYAALFLTFTVAWHRHYLLWPEPTSVRELFIWSKRHWVYLGRSLLIGLMGLIAFFAAGALILVFAVPLFSLEQGNDPQSFFNIGAFIQLFLIQFATLALVLVVLAAWLPSLPAAAIEDHSIGLRNSMKLTWGNRWRIGGILIVGSFLPFYGLQAFIQILVLNAFFGGSSDPFQAAMELAASPLFQIGLNFVSFFFSFLGIAVGVSLVTASYQQLRDNVPLEDETPAA